jgi:hypothetical protein
LHGGVGRNLHFLVRSRPLLTQTRPLDRQLAIAEHHFAGLLAIPNHLAGPLLALLARASHLLCR